jgi:hypothetical protein
MTPRGRTPLLLALATAFAACHEKPRTPALGSESGSPGPTDLALADPGSAAAPIRALRSQDAETEAAFDAGSAPVPGFNASQFVKVSAATCLPT